jgi:hypothetical protein
MRRTSKWRLLLALWITLSIIAIAAAKTQQPRMAEPAAICATGLDRPAFWTCRHLYLLEGNGWHRGITEKET